MTIIKICGITNLEDAKLAANAGADYLGFIFYPPSSRYVEAETVREIIRVMRETYFVNTAHESRITKYVGVFVNTPADEVRRLMDFCGLDFAQLHGDESPEMVASFGGRAFKAINPQSLAVAEKTASLVTRHSPFLLLDAFHPTMRGGTGKTADWDLAASIARKYPLLLAGGLTPENVATAIARVKPFGVDVSSGVEAVPGKKDPDKVRAFIAQVRGMRKHNLVFGNE